MQWTSILRETFYVEKRQTSMLNFGDPVLVDRDQDGYLGVGTCRNLGAIK